MWKGVLEVRNENEEEREGRRAWDVWECGVGSGNVATRNAMQGETANC